MAVLKRPVAVLAGGIARHKLEFVIFVFSKSRSPVDGIATCPWHTFWLMLPKRTCFSIRRPSSAFPGPFRSRAADVFCASPIKKLADTLRVPYHETCRFLRLCSGSPMMKFADRAAAAAVCLGPLWPGPCRRRRVPQGAGGGGGGCVSTSPHRKPPHHRSKLGPFLAWSLNPQRGHPTSIRLL